MEVPSAPGEFGCIHRSLTSDLNSVEHEHRSVADDHADGTSNERYDFPKRTRRSFGIGGMGGTDVEPLSVERSRGPGPRIEGPDSIRECIGRLREVDGRVFTA